MACNIADDRKLMFRLVDLSENRISLYMNADNTPSIVSRGKVQLWTGKSPLSIVKLKLKFEEGWYRFINGEKKAINSTGGKTGSIYIDPRKGKDAINEL